MRLTPEDARERLRTADHAVLGTLHAERGPDLVPCVFALADDDRVGIPVDRVKPKTSTRLQRDRNLQADPRATLLVERWDAADWSRLWWVRARLHHEPDPSPDVVDRLAGLLEERYDAYRGRPFASVLVLRLVGVTGWAAGEVA